MIYIEVDPYAKPPELMRVNPRGLVPALVDDGRCLYESMVLMEYADEKWGDTDLLPCDDPYLRAIGRIWMDHINKKVVPHFYQLLQRQDEDGRTEAAADLLKGLKELFRAYEDLGSGSGPFFYGRDRLSMVDMCVLPWAIRFSILKHYRGFEVPRDGSPEFERFHWWLDAALQQASVRATLQDEGRLRESYQRYADNKAGSEVSRAINAGKALP
eukprot:jgi/Chlat1/8520/Chrsp80S09220